jgi:hypothetical protein
MEPGDQGGVSDWLHVRHCDLQPPIIRDRDGTPKEFREEYKDKAFSYTVQALVVRTAHTEYRVQSTEYGMSLDRIIL